MGGEAGRREKYKKKKKKIDKGGTPMMNLSKKRVGRGSEKTP